MSPFRPAFVVAVVTCAGLATACHSAGKGPKKSVAAPSSPAAPACPSHAEIAHALRLGNDPKGIISVRDMVCRDGWATVPLRYPGIDVAYAVVRRENGTVRFVASGTAELCEDKEMKDAPAEIKKALGGYC